MSDSMVDALRRSVAARNNDPARMMRWLEDFAERREICCGAEESDDNGDPVQ